MTNLNLNLYNVQDIPDSDKLFINEVKQAFANCKSFEDVVRTNSKFRDKSELNLYRVAAYRILYSKALEINQP